MIFPCGYPYISPYDSTFDAFGTLQLAETDPAQDFALPFDVATVKQFLRVDDDDESQDTQLELMLWAAVDMAEIMQNRDLFVKQYDLFYDYWPAYRLPLRAPCKSVDLVKYTDLADGETTMQSGTDYVVDLKKQPAVIAPPSNRSWPAFTPRPSGAIQIRFTSGYAVDSMFWKGPGARVKMGIQLLISSWYEERLPFTPAARADAEMPFAVTSCLSFGPLERVK